MPYISPLDYFRARLEATISPVGLKEMQKRDPHGFVLVDVRIGAVPTRIPGAVCIPEPEITVRMGELPRDKLLILYCWETWCSLATKAAVPLLEAGHRVKELFGGIAAWQALGMPTEKGEEGEKYEV
jgi:rhodanese-related sulfurtransferase